MLNTSRNAALLGVALCWGAAVAQGTGAPAAGENVSQAAALQGEVRRSGAPISALDTAREAVESHRARIEGEVAELAAILAAQGALVEYVESGGAGEDEGLDPRLCRASALRPLCADLTETFGERRR